VVQEIFRIIKRSMKNRHAIVLSSKRQNGAAGRPLRYVMETAKVMVGTSGIVRQSGL
jgi:hypothetical protein